MSNEKVKVEDFVDNNPVNISWSRSLRNDLSKYKKYVFNEKSIIRSVYRPYCSPNLYFNKDLINDMAVMPDFFPNEVLKNLIICVSGLGSNKDFSVLISNRPMDYQTLFNSQCFPLYYYEENKSVQKGIFDDENCNDDYIRRDAISDFILERAKKQYGKNVSKEDIFFYVYGILHSKEYRETFANDLKKMLPRLPLVEDVRDFWKFSNAGRALAELHLNYETVAPFADVTVTGDDGKFYTVEKMRFPKKDQKDTIIYNSKISITNIPAKAYEYVVNGKSAIEWVMERYQVKIDLNSKGEGSGIKNDPNDWAEEVGNPRYILDLLLSIINVSFQTVDIVNGLPKIDFGAETSEGKEVNLYPTREDGDNLSIAAEPKLYE